MNNNIFNAAKEHSPMKHYRFALIGGPCTGKSTLLYTLSTRGHTTISEVSRELIRENRKKGSSVLPWLQRDDFQRMLLCRQLDLERKHRDKPSVIVDCSIPDGIAYYLSEGLNPPQELHEAARNNPYDAVFLLDFLPFYASDTERKEDQEQSSKVHRFIEQIHNELGHEIIHIPAMDVKKRADRVEQAIERIMRP
jgi:predicted ATPase